MPATQRTSLCTGVLLSTSSAKSSSSIARCSTVDGSFGEGAIVVFWVRGVLVQLALRSYISPLSLGPSTMRTPPRILIVDDNPTNVKVLKTRLAAEGYEVITAGDGEEGLSAAREQIPDLILLDVMMPKLDGVEVCRRLRADPA